MLEKGRKRQKKGGMAAQGATQRRLVCTYCTFWVLGKKEEEATPATKGRADLGLGCHLLLPLSQAVEVKLSSCFPPSSQARCVLALEHIWGQEVEQAVNSWTNSGNDGGPKERKELVYSGGNASCVQNLTSISRVPDGRCV